MVEYEADKGTYGLTREQVLWQNVENYEKIISEAAGKVCYNSLPVIAVFFITVHPQADIIVFPEYGLTTMAFPRPLFQSIGDQGQNPCLEPDGTSSEVNL